MFLVSVGGTDPRYAKTKKLITNQAKKDDKNGVNDLSESMQKHLRLIKETKIKVSDLECELKIQKDIIDKDYAKTQELMEEN